MRRCSMFSCGRTTIDTIVDTFDHTNPYTTVLGQRTIETLDTSKRAARTANPRDGNATAPFPVVNDTQDVRHRGGNQSVFPLAATSIPCLPTVLPSCLKYITYRSEGFTVLSQFMLGSELFTQLAYRFNWRTAKPLGARPSIITDGVRLYHHPRT